MLSHLRHNHFLIGTFNNLFHLVRSFPGDDPAADTLPPRRRRRRGGLVLLGKVRAAPSVRHEPRRAERVPGVRGDVGAAAVHADGALRQRVGAHVLVIVVVDQQHSRRVRAAAEARRWHG